MRALAFAIAVTIGAGAAVAQTNDTGTTTQTQTGWNNGTTTATAGTTMASATPMVVQPSNAAPRRDARGIRVISAPAVVPIGYNGTSGAAMGGPLVDPATGQPISDTGSAQPCSRTVTDHCLQTYERGRAR